MARIPLPGRIADSRLGIGRQIPETLNNRYDRSSRPAQLASGSAELAQTTCRGTVASLRLRLVVYN
jgi:hypothetical protein